MPEFASMKLGKQPATRDSRTFKLAHYVDLDAVLPQIPDTIDYSGKVAAWPMFLNDQLGDCVIAAMAHQEEAASAENGTEVSISDQQVLKGYEDVGGYRPGHPNTDQGCDPLVALKYWQKTGIAGNTIGAYVSVDPTNTALIRAALYLFGGLFIGVDLPLSAQDQINAGQPWDVPTGGPHGRGEPGSWGGHMIYGVRQRGATAPIDVVTWGTLQPVTFAFLATYSPGEIFAVIPKAWLNDKGLSPEGFDINALSADLAVVGGQQPDPTPPPTPPGPTPTWQPNPQVEDVLAYLRDAFGYCAAAYAAATTEAGAQPALDEFSTARTVAADWSPFIHGLRKHAPSKPLPPVPSA